MRRNCNTASRMSAGSCDSTKERTSARKDRSSAVSFRFMLDPSAELNETVVQHDRVACFNARAQMNVSITPPQLKAHRLAGIYGRGKAHSHSAKLLSPVMTHGFDDSVSRHAESTQAMQDRSRKAGLPSHLRIRMQGIVITTQPIDERRLCQRGQIELNFRC